MNCEDVSASLAAYCGGLLKESECEKLEQHLEGCADCRESLDIWLRLGDLPEAEPSPQLRWKFERALRTQTSAGLLPRSGGLPRFSGLQWAGWAAAAVVLVMAGWAGGRYASSPAREAQTSEMAALRSEIVNLRTLVTLSLLTQQSASERLKGVGYAGRLREQSPNVVDALIHTMRYDPNVNVRLAACETLRRYTSEPRVRRAYVEALGDEESPLGKIALIDALVEFRDRESVDSLVRLASAREEDGAVKERASRALDQLKTRGVTWE